VSGRPLRADNETRTRDLNLGKVALYQLSYVRLHFVAVSPVPSASGTVAHGRRGAKIDPQMACPAPVGASVGGPRVAPCARG
jgi:hypothetical protein